MLSSYNVYFYIGFLLDFIKKDLGFFYSGELDLNSDIIIYWLRVFDIFKIFLIFICKIRIIISILLYNCKS